MVRQVGVNEFVKRQTKLSRFSHFEGTWEELERLACEEIIERPDSKPLLLRVPPERFWSGVVEIGERMELIARFGARREGEKPYTWIEAVAPKSPALKSIKHGFDVTAAAIGTVLLSPLLLVVSLSILLTMGRPVFFLQERVGLFGRRFRMIKFRTMVKDAEKARDGLEEYNEMSGPVFKISDDPRITRLGRFLRRTSIDELPQLINVLFGTMSLVGPRPLPTDEQQRIQSSHRRRLSMRPGITGLWQVSGRSDVDFEQWMLLDLRYIDEWSLQLDALILLKTFREVFLRTGAK